MKRSIIHCIYCGKDGCREITPQTEGLRKFECQECFWTFDVTESDYQQRFSRQKPIGYGTFDQYWGKRERVW